ncbi:MAG: hypothetical protein RLQ12_22375 [Cyclobacteriaceae bacterium]
MEILSSYRRKLCKYRNEITRLIVFICLNTLVLYPLLSQKQSHVFFEIVEFKSTFLEDSIKKNKKIIISDDSLFHVSDTFSLVLTKAIDRIHNFLNDDYNYKFLDSDYKTSAPLGNAVYHEDGYIRDIPEHIRGNWNRSDTTGYPIDTIQVFIRKNKMGIAGGLSIAGEKRMIIRQKLFSNYIRLAGMIIHEYCHIIGYRHPILSFYQMPFTVPYKTARLVRKWK